MTQPTFAFTGTLYVVGGNDGASALNSTEYLDRKTGMWVLGPILSIPRANCGVAVLENKLFAVGGFNGKKFLDTLEYMDVGHSDEWCSYLPVEYSKRRSEIVDNVPVGQSDVYQQIRVTNGDGVNMPEKNCSSSEKKSSPKENDLNPLKPMKGEPGVIPCNGAINGHGTGDRNS